MWPVGLCTKFGLSSPVVVNGTFVGFYDGWVAGRKFPVDMAGFAVNVQFLLQVTQVSLPLSPILSVFIYSCFKFKDLGKS
jgi:beta-1,3-glucuronyltransferase